MSYEGWRGPSELDGSTEIVCLISGDSKNKKSGEQLQVWILRADMSPQHAINQGADQPICGDCVFRNGSCYVLAFWGPRKVWVSWAQNPLPMPRRFITKKSSTRFGAYGDPAAVPYPVLYELAQRSGEITGFTHQWRTCDQRYRNLLMASVETEEQAEEAQAMGWRTYRVTTKYGWRRTKNEVLCPASEEAGKKLTCAECGHCNGHATGRKGNVVIPVHGAPWKQKRFETSAQPQATIKAVA